MNPDALAKRPSQICACETLLGNGGKFSLSLNKFGLIMGLTVRHWDLTNQQKKQL